ncbi:LysR substrate-binding domain-containing protein [Afipia sp. Root123D2]|uniref:LysR substrate-binding domain-containing protein n=1 Tax=Afipia sp. Root123D2 TaxID=1736436 RepID=UPI000ACDACA2|nr:LysR substrate-binding domain-containing protein [Afipia sp. Root123D2]
MGPKKLMVGKIELRHLRYFLVTVEEMHFGRAAERLGIAQPGLSQQIMALEEIVGTPLFDRRKRAVQLTLAGEIFAGEARKTIAQSEMALLAARQAGRGEVGRIAVGYVGSAAYTGMLTRVINKFRDDYPDVELQISEMEMLEQLNQISEGKLDIGFIRPPVTLPIGIASVEVLQERLLLAIPSTHALASRERVPLAAFNSDIFITPRHPPKVSFHKYTTQACQAAGFFPRLGPQGRDFVTITSMVSIGLGVALVPQSVKCIQLPDVRFKPIIGKSIYAELAVAFRRSEPSPAARAFAQHARRFASPNLRQAPDTRV